MAGWRPSMGSWQGSRTAPIPSTASSSTTATDPRITGARGVGSLSLSAPPETARPSATSSGVARYELENRKGLQVGNRKPPRSPLPCPSTSCITTSRGGHEPGVPVLSYPAMAAGVSDHVWKIDEIVALLG